MTLLENLPPNEFHALKLATPQARLLPVKRAEDMGTLPHNPELLFGKFTSRRRLVLNGFFLLIGTIVAVGFLTGNALNHGGAMPIAWDIIWIIFPWLFLLPLWRGYIRRWRASTRTQQNRTDDFTTFAAAAQHSTGMVVDRTLRVNDSSRAIILVLLVHTRLPGRPLESLVVTEVATLLPPLESEVPQVGDTVIVWADLHAGGFPDTIVQSNQAWSRTQEREVEPRAAIDPTLMDRAPAENLIDGLQRLSDLRNRGELTPEEFAIAKSHLLNEQ